MAQAAGALGWQLSGADLKRIGTSSLAKFELLGEIGRGSFSVVHKARSTVDGTLVAIKKVKAKEMLDEKARRDCEQEVALLQRLDHPQIIKYLSSFFEDGELFIVLELAGGGDLARFIKCFRQHGKLIPELTIWKYFSQVCAALKHMHLKRIMHRDVKPANVFITIDGRVKLGDLGLGRFFSPDSVAANSLVGTPYYMSPERVQRHEYDFSSDVWSAGCLLYEMAALQSPFANDMKNSYSLVKKIVSSEYPPISSNLYSDEDDVMRAFRNDDKLGNIQNVLSDKASCAPCCRMNTMQIAVRRDNPENGVLTFRNARAEEAQPA
ncbi:serine/threonine-protein kinase Nek7 isoform X2 [Rhipicephalus microplus]|uniref:serine/threonine-protein kinase Nek7 isoform X2 n=1 Tax=Rhipicephalus microplus TaxID=6941 RepID=UPI003F6CC038